jgi:lyso-ornithine lipid O-acyltransferase
MGAEVSESVSARGRRRSNPFLALLRLSYILGLTFYLLVLLGLRSRGRSAGARKREALTLFRRWADSICRALGIERGVTGSLPPPGCCVTPNHQSYLDILLLASIAAPLVFVAKAEIASWPGIGFLTRITDQIFIERSRSRRMLDGLNEVEKRLQQGYRVCIFLEGTTSGGDRVHRFYPSMLQPVVEAGAPIIPVAIRWSSPDPRVVVSEDIAYWKDHNFILHVWRILGLRGIHAEVAFGAECKPRGRDRRQLADDLHEEVQRMFEDLMSTRTHTD